MLLAFQWYSLQLYEILQRGFQHDMRKDVEHWERSAEQKANETSCCSN